MTRNKYRWNKEVYGKDYICSLDRKPDPKVEICLYVLTPLDMEGGLS